MVPAMSIVSALATARVPNLAFCVVGLFWGCFAAYVPEVKAQLGVGDATFGLLLLGQAAGLLTAMWLAPWFDRRFGPRAMQISGVAFAACWVLPGVITTPALFVVALVALGIGSGLLDVVMNARVSALEARHGRTLMSSSHGMFSVAYMVAALITSGLRGAGVPPGMAFAGFGLFAILLSVALYMPAPGEPDHDDGGTGKGAYPWGVVLICGLIVLSAFMSEATVETWSALHVERTLGGSAVEGALGPATLGLTMAIGRLGGQALTDRFHGRTIIICASLLASCGAILAAVAPTSAIAYAGFGILGLGVSVIGPLGLALVGTLVRAVHRTDAIAKAAVMGFSGFFFAPLLMGNLSEFFGLRVAYACVALILLSAIPMAIYAYSLKSPSKSDGT